GVMANELTELPTYEKGKASTKIEDMVHHAFANTALASSSIPEQKSATTTRVSDAHLEGQHNQTTQQAQREIDRTVPQPAQTVVGVFEHTNQGQVAIEYLLEHNFQRNQIEVSSKNSHHYTDSADGADQSITNWFKSVFDNDSDAKTYTDAAKTGCVITVQTTSLEEAQHAAQILDKHGAVNIDDSGENSNRNYRSRILDRNTTNF
ncbi:MAG: hypothetical protein H7X88_09595, partial [Gloeobacteraceae cyanobacterium ES-bin-316]|nr:hypothetical protein [Ferruginibacter sp.]